MKCNRREFLKSVLAAGAYIGIPKPVEDLIEQKIESIKSGSEIAESKAAKSTPAESKFTKWAGGVMTLQMGDEILELRHAELKTRYDDKGIDGFTGVPSTRLHKESEYCLYAVTHNSLALNNVIANQRLYGPQEITVRVDSTIVLRATGEVGIRWVYGHMEISLRDPEIGWA